jgi:hypothetical protein
VKGHTIEPTSVGASRTKTCLTVFGTAIPKAFALNKWEILVQTNGKSAG